MENCLVTKLKGNVNNNSLMKVGELHISVKANETAPNQYASELTLRNETEAFTVRATNGAYFTESFNTGTHLTSIDIPKMKTKSIYVGNSDGDIFIEGKYSLMFLGNAVVHNVDIMFMDTEQLKYAEKIAQINFGTKGLTGDLGDLLDKPLLNLLAGSEVTGKSIGFTSTNIRILTIAGNHNVEGNLAELPTMQDCTLFDVNDSPNITGNVAQLAEFPLETGLNIYLSGITGSIEDLVSAYISKGSGYESYEGKDLRLLPVYSNLTFGGNHYNTKVQYTFLSWESASKIWLAGGASSYASCTYIWCKGYTQEEANAKWPGKTIVRVDA